MSDPKLSSEDQPVFGLKYTRTGILVAAGIVLVVLLSIVYSPPLGLNLKRGMLQQLGTMFGFLLLVSLFVERAIEVIISIWSDPEADRLEQEIEAIAEARGRQQARIHVLMKELSAQTSPPPKRIADVQAEVDDLRGKMSAGQDRDDAIDLELVKYTAHTRKVSTWVGLAIGVLTAGVGFRVLHTLFIQSPPDEWYPHNVFFTLVDVLLTGALLSGGSKVVHHVFNVYESFMEATTKRAEASKAAAAS